jgi:cytoskeletal protein CcmA (bactofilin family)
MATRMQQRRGTAAQWISTNGGDGPVLNAGEIGFESDTNKFKIGDGINHWVDLDYFTTDSAEAVTEQVEAAINDLIGGAPGTLDTLNELAAALGDDPAFFTTIGTDLSDHTSATTNVHGIADTADLATQEYVTTAIGNSAVDQSALAGDGISWNVGDEAFDVDNTVVRQEALDLKAPIDSPAFTGTVTGVSKSMVGLGNVDNTSDANKPISSAAQTALNLKAPIAGPVFTGNVDVEGNLVVDGDFTVNGTNFSASATSITIEDNMLQLAHTNPANTVDLGLVVAYNDGVDAQHAGIVRDVSDNAWKLFKNVSTEPSTTVNFVEGELDDLHMGALQATSAVIGGVNNTEIQYLNGVTSAIQDQLDDKLGSTDAESTYAPIESPTFTGTVAGITATMVGLGNVDNSSDLDKPISTLTQTALDGKASLSGATFTGPVAGLDKSMVGLENVQNTADLDKPISTLTQTALDAKLSSATASTTYAPIESPTFTGTVAGITATMVGLANVDNTADLDKPVSTDTQAALDLKADLDSPTFTGSVSGITKSMVGLGNVDNTADLDKPISDDTQTALDAKLASATAASTYAPIADPTFTGTVSGVTKAMVGLTNVDDTADADKPVSTATQTALDAKAPIAAPSFTGNANFESNVTIEGNLVVEGTTTTVNTSEVQIDDPIFYLSANQYDTNTRDIGITGAYGTVGGDEEDHLHTGLVKDVTDGKWKLFSNAPHPVNNVIDFTSAAYDTLKVGPLEATTVTPSSGVVFSDGTQTKEGVPSRKTISQKTDSYTLSSLTERDSMIEISKSSAVTLTVPADATVNYPVGTSINILQTGSGQITVAPASGAVTVNATPGLKLRAQWSSATLVKRAANTWVLLGDLIA